MLTRFVKPALIAAASLSSLFAASIASAEYHVTAFGDTAGYYNLVSLDAEPVLSTLSGRLALDYAEANNLCVAQILAKDYSAAVASCELALEEVREAFDLTMSTEKSAKASIFSNMAVAKALAGDLEAANEDLKMALSLNGRDGNAVANFAEVSAKLPSGIAAAQ
jgi:hypothetical protein